MFYNFFMIFHLILLIHFKEWLFVKIFIVMLNGRDLNLFLVILFVQLNICFIEFLIGVIIQDDVKIN
jgi:hypothetical protein